jgi:hypothetical protein
MMRTFRVADGRTVVLPHDVLAGPGGSYARYVAGEFFTLPEERVTRFVRRRVEAGDVVETPGDVATAAELPRMPR